MHELANRLSPVLQTLVGASDQSSNQGVIIALITTVGVVLAAGIAAIAATFQRPHSAPSEANDVEILTTRSLIERAQRAETRADNAEARVNTLETWMWSNHINPETLRRIP